MLSKIAVLLMSPASPSAILLYGMVFGFAMWTYLGWPWLRSDTIILYLATSVWAMAVIVRRWRAVGFSLNRLDILFCAFLFVVLGSIATHWWEGTVKYLEFMPCFFVLPFLLGRMMGVEDVSLYKKILIGMGGVLLLLMPVEYWRNRQPGLLYVDSPAPILFGHGHGTMLTGLLLSVMLLALISMLMVPAASSMGFGVHERWPRLIGYSMLALVVITMVWISSRGSLVAAALGMIALFLFSSFCGWKKKMAILFYACLIAFIASIYVFQNQYHKDYYQQLIQRPPVTLDVEREGATRQARQLEYGKPILGEASCKNIADSVLDHWIHYQSAWEIFLAKPWTGVGANFYGFYSCRGPGWYPHSTILQVLAELGIMGGLVYFPMIGMPFYALIARYLSSVAVCAKATTGWALAFVVVQLTTSQLSGNYFMSAGLYFGVGLAASFLDGAEKKPRLA